jgi:hypothetical protein
MKKLILILTILLFASSAWGATYYFADDGDDSRSTAQAQVYTTPWQTMGKLESACINTAGNKCLLACDDTWIPGGSPELIGNTINISEANITIGAYRAADGVEVDGSSVVCASAKPTIDINADAAFNSTSSIIEIANTADNTTIKDIQLTDTCGRGIDVSYTSSPDADSLTITRVDISDTGSAAISTGAGDNFEISYSTMITCNQYAQGGGLGTKTGCTALTYTGTQCLNANGDESVGGTIKYNVVGDIKVHEGIGANDNDVYGNVVYGFTNIGIYNGKGANSGETNIHHNLVWSDAGTCISVNNESTRTDRIVNVHNNFAIGGLVGFQTRNDNDSTGMVINAYANTLIDNETNINIKKTTSYPYTLNLYDNASIIYNTTHSAHANNEQAIGGSTFNKDYNFWHDSEAYDADFVGTNDVVGDPVLGKTSAWESLADEPTMANLALGATSDLKDAAQATSFTARVNPNSSDYTTSPPVVVTMTGDEIGAVGHLADHYFSISDGGDGQVAGHDTNGDGSFATPWRTIDKVEAECTGTDICALLCGDTWSGADWDERLNIDWNGMLVAYDGGDGGHYVDGSTYTCSGARPILDGNEACSGDSADLSAGINLDNANDGASLWDIEVREVNAIGIVIGKDHDDADIRRVKTDYTCSHGIYTNGADQVTNPDTQGVQDSEVRRDNWREWSGTRCDEDEYSTDMHGGGIVVSNDGNNWLIKGNKVYEGCGEGITAYRNSDSNIIEWNYVYDRPSPLLYINAAEDNIVRYNLAMCGSDTQWIWVGSSNRAQGLSLGDEHDQVGDDIEGNQLYGNVITGCDAGIRIFQNDGKGSGSRANLIYNNTLIDNDDNIFISIFSYL